MSERSLWQKVKAEWRPGPTGRCLLVFLPYAMLYLWTGRSEALTLAILGGGLFIATDGLGLGSRLLLLHFLATLGLFLLLFVTIGKPLWFALLCGLAALGVIALSGRAGRLRSFGNWIFIPSVYLACELGERRDWATRLEALPGILTFALMAPITVWLVATFASGSEPKQRFRTFGELAGDLGEPNPLWRTQSWAAFGSVLLAATLVEATDLDHGQWVIWSSLSVIAADVHRSHTKIRDRFIGVLIGCPAGLLLGLLCPHAPWLYPAATGGILLTLVAFRTYLLAFSLRCALTAFAAVVAGGTYGVAEERVANVLAGGLIGILAVHLADLIARGGFRENKASKP